MASQSRSRWTAADVPDQSGRLAVVTGASGGLGLDTAKVLARRGATVVLACRDVGKAERAADQIRAEAGPAAVRVAHLDLASLASVHEAAGEICSTCPRLDLLINNAGVMTPPYQRTEDGFELTFATNHLGHFALTGLVLDRMLSTPGSRIVTVSSIGHREGVMRFDDLQFERGYNASHAYWQSKLANLLFSYELQARLSATAAAAAALAAHPGVVRTDLWRTSSLPERVMISRRLRMLSFWAVQGAQRGALPTLRAATDPSAVGGEYYGPAGPLEYTGYPARVESSPRSHDVAAQRRLWEVSEQLTGVTYALAGPAGQRERGRPPGEREREGLAGQPERGRPSRPAGARGPAGQPGPGSGDRHPRYQDAS
jgi:NAD(P)-dependent dehydrogenase (short-subunit alcohol dehydrogenase family)